MQTVAGLWLALAAALGTACGGHTKKTVANDTQLPEGPGVYDLVIESVSDDCVPRMVSGNIGSVIVVVAEEPAEGANIPLCGIDRDDSSRQDVSFSEQMAFDTPRMLSGCSAMQHMELSTLNVDSVRLDIDWKWTLSGVATCPSGAGGPTRDCTTHRVLHFKWLRTCPDGGCS